MPGSPAAYAPSHDLIHRWQTRLQWMEPLLPCGRCPQCRLSAAAANTDPPPAPEQIWAVDDHDLRGLFEFVSAARGVNGVALMTYRPDEQGLAPKIARGLVALGVRHIGGQIAPIDPPRGEVLFTDERALSPAGLTPRGEVSRISLQAIPSRAIGSRDGQASDSTSTVTHWPTLFCFPWRPGSTAVKWVVISRASPALPPLNCSRRGDCGVSTWQRDRERHRIVRDLSTSQSDRARTVGRGLTILTAAPLGPRHRIQPRAVAVLSASLNVGVGLGIIKRETTSEPWTVDADLGRELLLRDDPWRWFRGELLHRMALHALRALSDDGRAPDLLLGLTWLLQLDPLDPIQSAWGADA